MIIVSVIIDDLDVGRTRVFFRPDEANAPLLVDADRLNSFGSDLRMGIIAIKTGRGALEDRMIEIHRYQSEHFARVDALWKDAFPDDNPWNVAAVAIPEKIRVQPDLMLVALEKDQVVGSIMAGYDGHRGWISRIAVLTSHRDRGIGQALIAAAEERLAALGCIKINLQVIAANAAVVEFYKRAGYQIEERISMSKLLGNG